MFQRNKIDKKFAKVVVVSIYKGLSHYPKICQWHLESTSMVYKYICSHNVSWFIYASSHNLMDQIPQHSFYILVI